MTPAQPIPTPIDAEQARTEPLIQGGNLRQLQERVTLALDFSSHDKIHELGILIDHYKRVLKEIENVYYAQLAETIQAQGKRDGEGKYVRYSGDFKVEETLYTVSPDKKIKCRDVKTTLSTLIDKFKGDLDKVAQCLSTSAWKYGEIRTLLEELKDDKTFDALFETTVDWEAERKEPKAKKVNLTFIPKKAVSDPNALTLDK
jgi:hypothetical protein